MIAKELIGMLKIDAIRGERHVWKMFEVLCHNTSQ
jgi:hypothetical protein